MKKCKVEYGCIRFMNKKYYAGAVVELDDYSYIKLGDQVFLVEEPESIIEFKEEIKIKNKKGDVKDEQTSNI